MKTYATIPLGEFAGQRLIDPSRGAIAAARKVEPRGAGWLPKSQCQMTRAERIAIYRRKREAGRMSDESWAAIDREYPEVAR